MQSKVFSTTSVTATSFTRSPDGTAIGYRKTAANYFVTDHLGSVIGMFASNGTYVGGYSYSPYGETRAAGFSTALNANPLRYIGGQLDASGLYKLGARFYDPALGRFTQPDPSGQESNPYGYASCNPTNQADPSGLAGVQVLHWDCWRQAFRLVSPWIAAATPGASFLAAYSVYKGIDAFITEPKTPGIYGGFACGKKYEKEHSSPDWW